MTIPIHAWQPEHRSSRAGVRLLLILAVAVTSVAFADDPDRQAEVAARGAEVMPFKLSATTHIFTKIQEGALQQVIVKDPKDMDQVRLIRQHLSAVAGQFTRGDFSGPTDVHGAQMPGLAKLKTAKPGDIEVSYQDLVNGGQIRYSTRDPALVHALHQWIDAQLSDHGSDSQEGHEHHHPPPPQG